ncbi:MAG: GtrA family protein, partial [Clostridiales bacterium]|nr:GtrA family protein [Clostridiales bacterium]
HYIISNIIAWILAVTFAYFANGRWVYNSTSRRGVGEAGAFFVTRLFSLGVETLILFLMVDLGHINELLSKVIVTVVVVVMNYLTGLMVFRRKKP